MSPRKKIFSRGRFANKTETVIFLVLIFNLTDIRSSEAVFDAPIIEIPADALATGNLLEGVGFSALRAEDKKRLKRMRERYLELNPSNLPNIKLFDIDTQAPEADVAE